jgi:GTP-binding protein HflX
VASFRSTLEELREADLLLHVVDASSSQAREQFEVTEGVLKELGLESKPRMTVLNKADLIHTPAARNRARLASPGSMMVSAFNPEEVRKLRDRILDHFRNKLELWEIMVPYSESRLESQLYAYGAIETNRHMEKGTFYRLRIEQGWARKLGLEKYRL